MSRIEAVNGDKRKEFAIEEGLSKIGRQDPSSDNHSLEINLYEIDLEQKVSQLHGQIERSNEKLLLEDLGSTNGTYLINPLDNSQTKLEVGRKYPIRVGDTFLLGRVIVRVLD